MHDVVELVTFQVAKPFRAFDRRVCSKAWPLGSSFRSFGVGKQPLFVPLVSFFLPHELELLSFTLPLSLHSFFLPLLATPFMHLLEVLLEPLAILVFNFFASVFFGGFRFLFAKAENTARPNGQFVSFSVDLHEMSADAGLVLFELLPFFERKLGTRRTGALANFFINQVVAFVVLVISSERLVQLQSSEVLLIRQLTRQNLAAVLLRSHDAAESNLRWSLATALHFSYLYELAG